MIRNAWELDTWQAAGRSMKLLYSPAETGTKNMSAILVEFEPGLGTAIHTHDATVCLQFDPRADARIGDPPSAHNSPS